MPETLTQLKQKEEVREALAQTGGKPKIKAQTTDKFWFATHIFVLLGCALRLSGGGQRSRGKRWAAICCAGVVLAVGAAKLLELTSGWTIGLDRILWQSEFPRSTSTYPESARMIENNFAEVPVQERELILWRNAAELFGRTDLLATA